MDSTAEDVLGFRHEALVYRGLSDFVAALASFLREGIAGGEPAMVAVDREKIDALRNVLDDPHGLVEFVVMHEIGGNPARMIPAWQAFVDRHPGRALRGIGEPV